MPLIDLLKEKGDASANSNNYYITVLLRDITVSERKPAIFL
jgi:hypothetical protein